MGYVRLVLILSVFLFFLPVEGRSHSGGTDAEGCHVNTKTGKKHCHSEEGGKKLKNSKKDKPEKTSTKKKSSSKKKSKTKTKKKSSGNEKAKTKKTKTKRNKSKTE